MSEFRRSWFGRDPPRLSGPAVIGASLLVGTIAYLTTALLAETQGASLFIGVPVCFGTMFGLRLTPRTWLIVLGLPTVILAMLLGLAALGVHGPACLAMIGLVFLLPAFVGAALGALFAALFGNRTPPTRRRYRTFLLLALVPPLLQIAEDRLVTRDHAIIEVSTAHDIDAPPEEVWRSLHFYEEIGGEVPLLLRIGMPVPVRAEGSKAAVGDIETCVYERGHLKKRITERVESCRLAFDVIEQAIHFERDLTLVGGSFDLAPLGRGTRLTLSTRYRPLCYPSFVWRPLEAWVLHTLHGHVAGAIRRRAGSPGQDALARTAARDH